MNIMKVGSMTSFQTMTHEREFTQPELKVIVVEIYSLKSERKLFFYHVPETLMLLHILPIQNV